MIVASLDTGPGLNAVDVAGTYAYAANNDINNQLQIIDISNRTAPVLLSSYKLPGVSGSGATPQSIFYYANRVYIGTKQAQGAEFHVVDVSNSQSPASLGNFKVGADVNGIYVSGSIAYLATSDPNEEVKVLDVSNPATISKIGGFDAAGTSPGKSIYLIGSTLYVGRLTGSGNEFYVIDASNPRQLQALGSQSIGSDVNGIRVRDYLAFLATTDPNREFQAWNISNLGNMTLWSFLNFPEVATGIDYEDNLVYASVRSNDGLRIITSSP